MEYNGIAGLSDEVYRSADALSSSQLIPTCNTPTLSTVSQSGTGCVSAGATISLTGLVPSTSGLTVSYTINNGTVQTATGVIADASGNATFTTANLTITNNGQTLAVTKIADGTCNTPFSSSNTCTLSVIAASAAGTVASAQSICSGNIPADLTLSGNNGTTIQWQSSTTSASAGFSNLAGATSTTLSGSTIGSLTVSTWFRATVQNTSSCSVATATAVKITVNANPTITSTGTVNTVCYSASAQTSTLAYTATTGTPTSYSIAWDANAIAAQASTTTTFATGAGTVTTISIPAATAGNTYNGTLTVKTANACTATLPVTITVLAAPSAGTAAYNGTSVCNGSQLTDNITLGSTGTTGAVTKWQYSTNSGTSWTDIASSASSTLSPATVGNLSTGSYQFQAIVTNGAGCTVSIASNAVSVNVNAIPTPTFTSSKPTATINTNATYTTQSSQSNYVWNIDGILNTDYQIVSGGLGSTNASVTVKWIKTGTYHVTVNYTSNSCTAVTAASTTTDVSPLSAPPVLTAATGATVDNYFDITYTVNTAGTNWKNAITDITLNGTTLNATTDYSTATTGIIRFYPSANSLMQTPGSKSIIVNATSYIGNPVTQSIAVGANHSLNITSGTLAAPTTNGGALAAITLNFKDQFGNVTNSTESVTVTGNGTKTQLNGTAKTVAAINGGLTFSGLSVQTTDGAAQSNTTLTFTSASTNLTVNTNTFTIPSISFAATDYFKSNGTGGGLWSAASSWLISKDQTNWFSSSIVPSSTSTNGINIQSGDVIYATAAVTSANLTVNGTYEHRYNAGTIPTATWTTGSTCLVTGNTTTTSPGGLGQTFYNFTWSCSGQPTGNTSMGSGVATINGNFSILNTGAGTLLYSASNAHTLTVNGDLIIGNNASGNAAAIFSLSSSGNKTLNLSGNLKCYYNGYLTASSGTNVLNLLGSSKIIDIGTSSLTSFAKINTVIGDGTAVSSYKLNSDFNLNSTNSATTTFTVSANATLDLNGKALTLDNTSGVTATGTFTTNGTNSTVNFASSGAQTIPAINFYNLTSSSTGARTLASTGTIGVAGAFTPGTNTYTKTTSTISFNGGAAQSIPGFTFNNLTLNNSKGATLGADAGVGSAGILSLSSGTLSTGTNTLTLAGTIATPTGNINASAGTVNFTNTASLTLPAGLFTGNINNFTTSGTSSVTLGGNTTITGTLYLNNSRLNIGANNTLTIGVNGASTSTISATGTSGVLRGSTTSDLTINGAGGFSLPLDQSSPTSLNTNNIRNFILNTTGNVTLGTGSNMKVNSTGSLTLTKGTLDVGANTFTINGTLSSAGTGLLNVSAGTLAIGATSFTLNNSKLTSTTLNNLTVGNATNTSVVTMSGNNTIAGILNIQTATATPPAVAIPSSLSIGAYTLTISGTGSVTGAGYLIGSSNTKLSFTSSTASTLNFNPGVNDSLLNTLTLDGTGKVTLGSGLGITKLLKLNNTAAVLDINGHYLTLKSTSDDATAEFDQVVGNAKIIDGTKASPYTASKVTVERFIPNGLRTFRDLGPSVYGAGSIYSNWQEKGAYPSNYGMYITGKLGTFDINSSPVSITDPATGFDYTPTGNPSLYTYKDNVWANLDATLGTKGVNLDPFQGMRTLIRGARNYNLNQQFPTMVSATTLRATGTLVTGDVTFTTTGTSSASGASSSYGLTAGANAYSLIANPFACPIDWYSIYQHNSPKNITTGKFTNNISSSYSYMDPTFLNKVTNPDGTISFYSVYITYNAASNVTNNAIAAGTNNFETREFIQSGQAFFVQNWDIDNYSSSNTTQLVISETDKAVGQTHTNVFSAEKPNLLAITLWRNFNGTSAKVDGAVAVFRNDFTKKLGAEDSRKMRNSVENLSITESVNDLSIDGLPTPAAGDVVALKLDQVSAGTAYQLKVDVSNYDGLDAYIHDALTSTDTPATEAVSFTATTDAASYANRFSVVFKATKTLPVVKSGMLSVYPNPVTGKVVTVQTTRIAAGKYNVSMMNNLGQTVYTTTISHQTGSVTETIRMNKVLPSGVYTMSMKNTNGTGNYLTELIIKN